MRAKKAKMLARKAHQIAPEKENNLISKIVRSFLYGSISDAEIINVITHRYTPDSPRAIYKKMKKEYKATPRTRRSIFEVSK